MTKTNETLIKDFMRHGETGTAARMEVTRHGGWAFLWGYGWALYAARKPAPETPVYLDPDVFVYTGWEGYSSTTSSHMHLLMPSHDRFVGNYGQEIEEVDADPGYKGGMGFKSFEPADRDELADFGDEIVP